MKAKAPVSILENKSQWKYLDEETLIRQAQSGDTGAMGELFSRYRIPVRKMVVSIANPGDELDDLVQEVFINVYRSIFGFRGASSFSTWLFRIAIHTTVSHLRKPKRLILMSTPEERLPTEESDAFFRAAEGREMVRRMYAILDTMSPKRRVALTLFEFQGLSLEEMSMVLKVPKSVVKSRLFFARQELRRKAADDPLLSELLKEMSI